MNYSKIFAKRFQTETDSSDQAILSTMSTTEILDDIKKLQDRLFTKERCIGDKELISKMKDELFYREHGYRKVKFYNVKVNPDFSVNFAYTGNPQKAQIYYPAGTMYGGYIWTDIGWQRHD